MNQTKKVILLVEDDEHDAFFMQRAMQKAGISLPLQIVENGEEALAYLLGDGKFADRETYPLPFLIFLDLKLPLMDGFQVLEQIRQHASLKTMPVFILTSSSEERDRDRAAHLGVNGYFVKPPNPGMLTEVIQSLSGSPHSPNSQN